jgi:nucleoside-triphosphatase THEP1
VSRWALIAGPKHSDKAQVARRLASALETAGVPVGGFVQVRRVDGEDRKHYDLLRVSSGERVQLATETTHASGTDESFCSLRFATDAFAMARSWLERDAAKAEVLFIGDVSKLEVSGGGHDRSIRRALALRSRTAVVLCVRSDQLFYAVERYGLGEDVVASLELPTDEDGCQQFIEDAVASLSVG